MLSPTSLYKEELKFSRLVLGMWRIHEMGGYKSYEALIKSSLDLGITTFDHADIYGGYTCEELFGQILRKEPSLRDQMQLVTKTGIKLITPNRPHHTVKAYDTSYDHIVSSLENSLKMLATDRVDLLLIHRPDPLTDPHEVARAFDYLKQSGKVLHFGVSNFTPSQFDMLQLYSNVPLVTNQIEISIIAHQPLTDGTLDHCLKQRIKPMAWSPLANGTIFQKDSDSDQVKSVQRLVGDLKEKYDVGADQLLLMWLLKHPSYILPVIGTSKVERLKSALASLDKELERDDWFKLYEATLGDRVP